MRYVHRIAGIDGIAAGASPRIKLPTGERRYHAVKFNTTVDGVAAAPATVLDRIRIYVNGITIRDVSVARLLAATVALNGKTIATNELPLYFSEPGRADKVDEVLTAWDMKGEGTMEIELVCAAAPGGVPGVTGLATFDFGSTLIDGKLSKRIIRQVEVGKGGLAGDNDFDNLPIRDPIQRIHLFAAADDITFVEVTADRSKVFEASLAEAQQLYNDYGLNGNAVDGYSILFDFSEQISDALPVQRELNVRFRKTAAAAVTALVESAAPGFF